MLFDLGCKCTYVERDVYKKNGWEEELLSRPCPACGKTDRVRLISAPARTVYLWGDTPWTTYDYGLGQHITSRKDRDEKMKALGLRQLETGEIPK